MRSFIGVPRTARPHPLPDGPVDAKTATAWIMKGRAPEGLHVTGELNFTRPLAWRKTPDLLRHWAPPRLPRGLRVDTLRLDDGHVPDGARIGRCRLRHGCSFGSDIECGNLGIENGDIETLPADLRVTNRVDLSNCAELKTLPEGFETGFLALSGSGIETLPSAIRVRNRIDLSNCARLHTLPDGLETGTLDLSGCRALEALPARLSVAFLDLKGCDALRALPDDLTIRGGRLDLSGCAWIDRLPTGMGRMAQLDLSGCLNLTTLPDDLDVTAWIDLGGSGIETLPPRLRDVGLRWNGIPCTPAMIFEPQTLDPQAVLTERNAELRRVMMERYGYDRLMADCEAETLDTDRDAGGERRLLRIEVPDDEPLVCVSVRCPSTGHHFMLRVPPTMCTCRAAIAWTAGMDEAAYAPRLET